MTHLAPCTAEYECPHCDHMWKCENSLGEDMECPGCEMPSIAPYSFEETPEKV